MLGRTILRIMGSIRSLMAAAGVEYPQLVARLVEAALERAAHERSLRR